VTDAFRTVLARYRIADLEQHRGAIIGLSDDLRLSYLSPAWFRFAAANGGEPRISAEWPLGRSIAESWPFPYRDFYEARYRATLRTRCVWTHEYECSAPDANRTFHQIVYPVPAGLLVVHSQRVVLGAGAPPDERNTADPARYVGADGIVSQCMHCRRVRRAGAVECWDWIPEWATRPPTSTSHGLCETCFRFYYPV
jgi:hypothetical protein